MGVVASELVVLRHCQTVVSCIIAERGFTYLNTAYWNSFGVNNALDRRLIDGIVK